MDHPTELKKLASDFEKYRRMQNRLQKLRNGKAAFENIEKAKGLLANIAGHLKMMDANTARILAAMKGGKANNGVKMILVESKNLVN